MDVIYLQKIVFKERRHYVFGVSVRDFAALFHNIFQVSSNE